MIIRRLMFQISSISFKIIRSAFIAFVFLADDAQMSHVFPLWLYSGGGCKFTEEKRDGTISNAKFSGKNSPGGIFWRDFSDTTKYILE